MVVVKDVPLVAVTQFHLGVCQLRVTRHDLISALTTWLSVAEIQAV